MTVNFCPLCTSAITVGSGIEFTTDLCDWHQNAQGLRYSSPGITHTAYQQPEGKYMTEKTIKMLISDVCDELLTRIKQEELSTKYADSVAEESHAGGFNDALGVCEDYINQFKVDIEAWLEAQK